MITFSEFGKKRRMQRILNNGKTLIVPVDDSLIAGPYKGLYDLRKTITDIEEAIPSAILGFKGGLSLVNSESIPLILNITASTIRGTHVSKILAGTVEEAIRMDVDCLAVHINYACDEENKMLSQLSSVITEADRFGLPVLAISYPRKTIDGKDYNYDDLSEDDFSDLICHCTRTSVELGADIVKTKYTGSRESFERVVNSALGHPVVIAGGELMDVDKAYEMAKNVIDAGGAGISFGRNVFNRKDIKPFILGIKEIIFNGSNVKDALDIYQRCKDV